MQQAAPVAKNDIVETDITGLTHEGHGVGRVDGFALFIPGALPGERVRVKVVKVKKQYGYGKLLDILSASPHRTEPACPVYARCGGCQWQHLDYAEQLQWKRQQVVDALARIGGLSSVPVHPTIGMAHPWQYRNKAQVPVGLADGRVVTGFYAPRSHRVIPMERCGIQHPAAEKVLRAVREWAQRWRIAVYDEERHAGLLRHVVVKTGFATGEVMAILVTNGERVPHVQDLIARLRRAVPGLVSVIQNIQTERTNVIFGERSRVLWGRDVIYDRIGDIRFAISARSFYQVNPLQTEVLYAKAVEYAGLTGRETVIDAYCGVGTISLFLARRARHVYGVEVVPEAVEDARRNAALNGMDNVTFVAGEAETVIPQWAEEGMRADVIVVDPPRKGCDPRLLDAILAMSPPRVVYVSCNPATLARDLKYLAENGYEVQEVQPVDMFPQTVHVECVTWLTKNF